MNNDTLMVFGGRATGAGHRAQMLDLRRRRWFELPPMPIAYRWSFTCGLARNGRTGNHHVVVVAASSLASILDLSTMTWRKGNSGHQIIYNVDGGRLDGRMVRASDP